MSLAQSMKASVENFYGRIKAENPFYVDVLNGSIRHETVAYFLESVRHLVAHTPKHCILAAEVCESKGLKELGLFFRQKLKEEVGHDKWAEEDLEKLAAIAPKTIKARGVAPTINKILARNEATIRRDPYLYLVHVFFAEYFTVCDGPDFMKALAKLRIVPDMVSVVNNHVELDVGHVAEWEETIGDLVSPDEYGKTFLSHLDESFNLYEQFCRDMESYNHAQ